MSSFRRRLARRVERALAIVGGTMLLFHACFQTTYLVSDSMAPTLKGPATFVGPVGNVELLVPGQVGDRVLTEKLSYRFREPRRWEVLTYRNDIGQHVMKRVVGLPGESLRLNRGSVEIDGAPIERPGELSDVRYYPFGVLARGQAVGAGDGYFVMGDNSSDSQDSRFEGSVPPSAVEGRAWWIYWPPSRFGPVNP